MKLLLVVEGYGEVKAAPALTRRILHSQEIFDVEIDTHRRHDISYLRANDWYNFRRYLLAAYSEECPILWMIDCDDDCFVDVLRDMVRIANETGIRQPIGFTLWVREYETMFLYDQETTKKVLNIDSDLPNDPLVIRGAKGWLSRHMLPGSSYKETHDQEAISAQVDVGLLQTKYRCFEHFCSTLTWLYQHSDPAIYPFEFD